MNVVAFQRTRMSGARAKWIGEWRTDPDDASSLADYGSVSIAFRHDGRLRYEIPGGDGGDRKQIIDMTFRVEGEWLITDQPSHPNEERVRFSFNGDDRLVIHSSPPAHYVRTRQGPLARIRSLLRS